jgi:branched-chain amino acid transport system substrate-binding protein
LIAGCGKEPRVVRIGVAMPLTGPTAPAGAGALRAVELAVFEARESGAFPYQLEIVPVDDRGEGETAVDVANLIVSKPDVVAVIGHLHSETALAASPLYAKAGIPLLVPGATHPELTLRQLSPDWPGARNVFRLLPHDGLQGRALADLAYTTLGLRRLVVLHDGTAYGSGLAERVRSRFSALGGGVPVYEAVARGSEDFEEASRKWLDSDGVFFGGIYVEAGLILKTLRAAGWEGRFLSGDGARTPQIFEIAGAAVDGSYFSTPGLPADAVPDASRFLEAYRARYPGESLGVYDHFAYEAAEVLLDAIARVGPNRRKLLDMIRRTDRYGILGRTRFDSKGDVRERRVSLWKADADSRSFLMRVDHQ